MCLKFSKLTWKINMCESIIEKFRVVFIPDKLFSLHYPQSRDLRKMFSKTTSGVNMERKKNTKSFWCVAEGCSSDDRKVGKFGYMAQVEFFPFPTQKKNPKQRKKWLDLLRREDYEPQRNHRICSLHFVDGMPTAEHPFPELFAYNNYKRPEIERRLDSIMKRDMCRASSVSETESGPSLKRSNSTDVARTPLPPVLIGTTEDG